MRRRYFLIAIASLLLKPAFFAALSNGCAERIFLSTKVQNGEYLPESARKTESYAISIQI